MIAWLLSNLASTKHTDKGLKKACDDHNFFWPELEHVIYCRRPWCVFQDFANWRRILSISITSCIIAMIFNPGLFQTRSFCHYWDLSFWQNHAIHKTVKTLFKPFWSTCRSFFSNVSSVIISKTYKINCFTAWNKFFFHKWQDSNFNHGGHAVILENCYSAGIEVCLMLEKNYDGRNPSLFYQYSWKLNFCKIALTSEFSSSFNQWKYE